MSREEADKDFLNWFAGFVAGEGCFLIVEAEDGAWRVGLAIQLRDDDLDILLEIQERLGMGRISRRPTPLPSKPQARWEVAKISDCVHLVGIFEAHPLRAKKQRDFEIWKVAVKEIYAGKGWGGKNRTPTYDRNRLRYLAAKLRLVRSYDKSEGAETNETPEDGLQLSFYESAKEGEECQR